jgi:hypothetical protein
MIIMIIIRMYDSSTVPSFTANPGAPPLREKEEEREKYAWAHRLGILVLATTTCLAVKIVLLRVLPIGQ